MSSRCVVEQLVPQHHVEESTCIEKGDPISVPGEQHDGRLLLLRPSATSRHVIWCPIIFWKGVDVVLPGSLLGHLKSLRRHMLSKRKRMNKTSRGGGKGNVLLGLQKRSNVQHEPTRRRKWILHGIELGVRLGWLRKRQWTRRGYEKQLFYPRMKRKRGSNGT